MYCVRPLICCVPVIATPVGGVPEIIKHRQTSILGPARDSVSLAKAIGDVLNPTSDLVLHMVDQAEAAAKNMVWEMNGQTIIAVYQDILTKFTVTHKRGLPAAPLEGSF